MEIKYNKNIKINKKKFVVVFFFTLFSYLFYINKNIRNFFKLFSKLKKKLLTKIRKFFIN